MIIKIQKLKAGYNNVFSNLSKQRESMNIFQYYNIDMMRSIMVTQKKSHHQRSTYFSKVVHKKIEQESKRVVARRKLFEAFSLTTLHCT